MLFKKPANALEGANPELSKASESASETTIFCNKCKKEIPHSELVENLHTCPYCRHHFQISARRRIHMLCDEGSFVETDSELRGHNILEFPDYDDKLERARGASSENEGVLTGTCSIGGVKTAVFVMEPRFMMGSMGAVVGEKITRTFELATHMGLPVVGFTVSGGARMQEGIISLMQMAKTSGAVGLHSAAGGLYVCVLTNPTTGGVTASFAMEADVILAEPYALIGFAGPRVIEMTIRKKLPEGFQRSEFLLERGFVDEIVDRRRLKTYLTDVLKIHENRAGGNAI